MPDRPPPNRPLPSGTPLGGAYASAEDAVYEDLGQRGDGHTGDGVSGDGAARPAWAPLAGEPPVVRPAVQVGDPFRDAAAASPPNPAAELGYDPDDGFRIDFDGDEEPAPATSTALAPIRRDVPAPRRGGPPAPPRRPGSPAVPASAAAPRAETRQSVRNGLRMLRRHGLLIALVTGLGLAAGAAHGFLTPPTFEAHSVLLIVPNESGGVADAPGADASKVVNQGLVLQQAPEIAERAAAALLVRRDAEGLSVVQAAAGSAEAPLTPQVLGQYLQEDVVTVEQADDRADAIRVAAEAATAEEAALVARLYTAEYEALTRATSRERSTQTRAALEEQIALREGELAGIEARLDSFLTVENAAGLDEQTRTTVTQIGQLQAQLDLARVDAQTSQARLDRLREDLASVPNRLERSAYTPSQVETADLDAEITRLSRLLDQIYDRNPELRNDPSGHPDVARIDRQLRELRSDKQERIAAATDAAVEAGGLDLTSAGGNGQAYVAELRRQISTVQADLAGAEARQATLAARLAEARADLRAVPGQQVELGQLERQRATTETTLAQLRGEADRAAIAETTELGFVQLLREVQVPREPVAPKPAMSLALGGLAGLLLGLGLAFLRFQTDTRARTPDDLREHGFAVIGTVPDLTDALRGGRQDVEGASIHPGLVVLSRPFGPEAEAFRHLHAGLYAGGGAHPQVVLVGGPDGHSGKSLVAANLASAAAQAGRRTLLVDADLRRPAVGALFGLEPHAQLGEGPPDANLAYWSTAVPGLLAMTPRETAERPEQMWAPHQIGALLENLRAAFDLVVIDTPDALTTADATLLAPHADAALLVAEADRTDLDALAQVATELSHVGLGRVGAVLNRFAPASAVGFKRTAAVRHAPRT